MKLLHVVVFLTCLMWHDVAYSQQTLFSDQVHRVYPHEDHIHHQPTYQDVDGDNVKDIVSRDLITGKTLVYYNDATGVVQQEVILEDPSVSREYTLGDLDGDSDIDLLYIKDYDIYWSENLGNRSFASPVLWDSVSQNPTHCYPADVNNDGYMDVIVPSTVDKAIYLILNNGAGKHTYTILDSNTLSTNFVFDVADVNGDLIPDIIRQSKSFIAQELIVYLGTGSAFQAPITAYQHSASGYNHYGQLNDVDSNGQLDFFTVESVVSDLYKLKWYEIYDADSVVEHQTNKLFISEKFIWDTTRTGYPTLVYLDKGSSEYKTLSYESNRSFRLDTFGTFEGDHIFLGLDHWNNNVTNMMIGLGGSGKLRFVSYSADAMKQAIDFQHYMSQYLVGVAHLDHADLDNDGHSDIGIGQNDNFSHSYPSLLVTFCVNGKEDTTLLVEQDTFRAKAFELHDLNGDGLKDVLVVAGRLDDRVQWYPNLGNRAFDTAHVIYAGPSVHLLSVLDYDGDGDLDFLCQADTTLIGVENKGAGQFDTVELISGYVMNHLSAGDMDQDGDIDFVFAQEKNLFRARRDSNRGFQVKMLSQSKGTIRSVHLADIDNDKDFDVVFTSSGFGGEDVAVARMVSVDSFADIESLHRTSNNTYSSKLADLNKDGWQDVVFMDVSGGWNVNLLENSNGTAFQKQTIYTSEARGIQPLTLGDIDGDSDVDIIIPDRSNVVWLENVSYNPFITGTIFYDRNQNGQRDIQDSALNVGGVMIDPEQIKLALVKNGAYRYVLDTGSYKVYFDSVGSPDWRVTTDSLSYNVALSDTLTARRCDFGIYPKLLVDSGTLSIVNNRFRCAQRLYYNLTFKNTGTTVLKGELRFDLDTQLSSKIRWTPNVIPSRIRQNKWFWTFDELQPGQSITRQISTNDATLDGGNVTLGSTIQLFAQATYGSAGAMDTAVMKSRQSFFCSYDPNDKTTRPFVDDTLNLTLRNQPIFYTIRFQNTGNDTAYDVVIRDTLDPNLDFNTFSYLASSHAEVLDISIKSTGEVVFDFEDINLLDTGSDFDLSQGYVSFVIDHIEGLPDSTVILNQAAIFFDFNSPIYTNTTIHTIVDSLNRGLVINDTTDLSDTLRHFVLFPNPVVDNLTLNIPNYKGNEEVIIYDALGKRVLSVAPELETLRLRCSHWAPGTYYLVLKRDNDILKVMPFVKTSD